MQLFKRIIYLLPFLAPAMGVITESQSHFLSLPFRFGLVLSAYEFENSQENSAKSENDLLAVLKDSSVALEAQTLQAMSVAEVPREPALRMSRASSSIIPLACLGESVLELDLHDGALTSHKHYFASVDGNHQLRFEELFGSDSRASTAWLVSTKGQLEYQLSDLLYQCRAGESYKLYDAPIHSRCAPVLLDVVELVNCQ